MKSVLLATFFLALSPLPGTAHNSRQYVTCSQSAQTQAAMNACADQELQRAWPGYRDAYLEAMFPAADKQTEYGSIYPMQLALPAGQAHTPANRRRQRPAATARQIDKS